MRDNKYNPVCSSNVYPRYLVVFDRLTGKAMLGDVGDRYRWDGRSLRRKHGKGVTGRARRRLRRAEFKAAGEYPRAAEPIRKLKAFLKAPSATSGGRRLA